MRGCQEQTREGDLGGSPEHGWTGRPKADNILLVRWGVTSLASIFRGHNTPHLMKSSTLPLQISILKVLNTTYAAYSSRQYF
jgi:hypothetical protein